MLTSQSFTEKEKQMGMIGSDLNNRFTLEVAGRFSRKKRATYVFHTVKKVRTTTGLCVIC